MGKNVKSMSDRELHKERAQLTDYVAAQRHAKDCDAKRERLGVVVAELERRGFEIE